MWTSSVLPTCAIWMKLPKLSGSRSFLALRNTITVHSARAVLISRPPSLHRGMPAASPDADHSYHGSRAPCSTGRGAARECMPRSTGRLRVRVPERGRHHRVPAARVLPAGDGGGGGGVV